MNIYNLVGQQVRRLLDENKTAGRYTISWDGKNDGGIPVASGVYIYQLKVGVNIATSKMILLR